MKKKKLSAVMTSLMLVFTLALITTCEMAVDEASQRVALTDPYISRQPASYSFVVGAMTAPPTLTIEVNDWAPEDGTLTCQWFTFDTIEEYVKNNGGRAIGAPADGIVNEYGVTTWSYTPTLKTAKDDRNYYYGVVKNTNPKVNVGSVKDSSIQSEVSIISFSAEDEALAPVITSHPDDAEYQVGRTLNALIVRARSSTSGAVLSYTWYTLSIAADGTVTYTEIPDVTINSYLPDPTELKFGRNYYVVAVTSTEPDGKEATEISIPAIINIKAGVRANAPTITVQPKDRMYFIGDTVVKLSVAGSTRDNGVITYQWYSNSTEVIPAAGGTAITGQTSNEFLPPVSTTAAGTYYYYAVVTNTNESAAEEKVAQTTSKVAKVSVATPGTATANVTVTVANPKLASNRYQYVRGYGGMDVAWANFPEQKPVDMHTMYNPDILGYNLNRIMISPGKVDPIEGIQDLVNAHRPNYYENVKIVNSYGGYNLASPWSPPKDWKSNNSINGGGHLIYSYRQQFAAYLKRFAQNMYDNGAPIYAISISNEPNYTAGYDGCEWTPNEMRDFFIEVGRYTDGVRGFGGGKQIPTVLTVNGESANNPDINIAALTNPVSRSAIDMLCRHVYGNQTTTLWRFGPDGSSLPGTAPRTSDTVNLLDRGDGTKMEVWMTEHNINSANAQGYLSDSTWNYVWRYMNDVDLVMRLNNENAFVWWASKRFYSMIGDGQYGTIDGAVLPRGWGLSHYAKYTNDTHRLVTTITGTLNSGAAAIVNETDSANVNGRTWSMDNDSVRITAYASITSGKDNAPIIESADDVEFISLVMWTPTSTSGGGGYDAGTIEIKMPPNFTIGSYTAIKSTSASNTHVPETVTIAPDRQTAYVTLNRSQMLSVKFIKGE